MELIVGWIILAALVGGLATTKGRSGIGWFLIALILSPLIGLIGVAIVPSKKPAPVASASRQDPALAALRDLADLRDRGAVTDEEFEQRKAAILAR